MKELYQDEEYEEEDANGLEDDGEDVEGDEDTTAEISTIYGIPKNIFIIGVVVILLIIIGVIIFATSGGSDDDYVSDPNINTSTAVDYTDTTASDTTASDYAASDYTDTTASDTASDATGKVEFYDENNTVAGYYETFDGSYYNIYDSTGTDIGYSYDQGAHTAYDATGNALFTYALYEDDESAEGDYVESLDTDTEELRKLGYTGDEISLAKEAGVDLQLLKDHAQELRDEEAKESLVRMSDHASEEFQMIANNSIFCMNEIQFPVESYDQLTISEEHAYVVNADYWKVPTYGLQLYIKCKIANGTYVFYNVTPTRWVSLPEEGNIVLKITYRLYGNDAAINCYVTNIEEVDSTELTVNPQDSGINLNDIVKDAFGGELSEE